MAKVRLNLDISREVADMIEELADREDVTKAEIVRRGLAIIKAFADQMEYGRTHIGFSDTPKKLDAELVGILTVPARIRQLRTQTNATE